MDDYSVYAIHASSEGKLVFCKFLAANDTGETGGHQAGIYISKPSIPILFNTPGIKGENKDKWVRIDWQNKKFSTKSRFIYYGKGTRNEYRITQFGKGFPFLTPEYTGALFILVKEDEEEYQAFVLNTEDEINNYLDAFGLTPPDTNCLINTEYIEEAPNEEEEIDDLIAALNVDFPTSEEMSSFARQIWYKTMLDGSLIKEDPDKCLLEWTDLEFELFRKLEHARYGELIQRGFDTVEDFVSFANKVLNRRKSRAGKSLEHHLAAIFDANDIRYTAQATTEGNKKPDFIFPSEEEYHDMSFDSERLISLAAKTTCKDRWRQVINEADRLRNHNKYLCTLQQGISAAQMDEMASEKVVLVVPDAYINSYPRDRRSRIWTIKKFVDYVKKIEGK